jgi:hypothetical protein
MVERGLGYPFSTGFWAFSQPMIPAARMKTFL